MTYDLLIQGGRVIDPAGSRDAVLDVAISKGRIAAVADQIPAASRRGWSTPPGCSCSRD